MSSLKKNKSVTFICVCVCAYMCSIDTCDAQRMSWLFPFYHAGPGSIYPLSHLASPGVFITLPLSLPLSFSLFVCPCRVVYTRVCVWGVCLCANVVARGRSQAFCFIRLHLISLRNGLLLNLDLGHQPASPSDPSASLSCYPQPWSYRHMRDHSQLFAQVPGI